MLVPLTVTRGQQHWHFLNDLIDYTFVLFDSIYFKCHLCTTFLLKSLDVCKTWTSQWTNIILLQLWSMEIWRTLHRMVLNHMSLERFSIMAHLKGKKKMLLNITQNLSFGICSRFQNGLCPLYWSHRGRLCTHHNKVSLLINRAGTKRGWCVKGIMRRTMWWILHNYRVRRLRIYIN